MEKLLFHSNPFDRNKEATNQMRSGGWMMYDSKLFYEHILKNVLDKADKVHANRLKESSFSSYLDNNINIFSREYLLTCIYQMFCCTNMRNENDISPTIIIKSSQYRKNKFPLTFVELILPNIPTDVGNFSEYVLNESERVQCGLSRRTINLESDDPTQSSTQKKAKNNSKRLKRVTYNSEIETIIIDDVESDVQAQSSTRNNTKNSSQSSKRLTNNSETAIIDDTFMNREQHIEPNDSILKKKEERVFYNPILSKDRKRVKNTFFKYHISNSEQKGYLFPGYNVIDVIIYTSYLKYKSSMGTRRDNIRQFITEYINIPMGKCKFMLSMFFKDRDRLVEFVRNKVRDFKDNKCRTNILWSIDPEENHLSISEKSVRNDTWFDFLSGLKKGITPSAYRRLLEACDYYFLTQRSELDNIPYLNGIIDEQPHRLNLDRYTSRYDFLVNNCSSIEMTSLSTTLTETGANLENKNRSVSSYIKSTKHDSIIIECMNELISMVCLKSIQGVENNSLSTTLTETGASLGSKNRTVSSYIKSTKHDSSIIECMNELISMVCQKSNQGVENNSE